MEQFDLVAIGDLATDAFIRLTDVGAHVNREAREICLKFGEKIPYESVAVVPAVGNSANAAVCAAKLGLKSALVSNVGADLHGEEALKSLAAHNVHSRFISKHAGLATNYHYVLWYHDDRTILVKHENFPYSLPFDFAQGKPPAWIYLSSLGENSLPFHAQIADYLNAHPEIKLAFSPGTYQIKFGAEALTAIYKRTDVFFCNTGEAIRILTNGSSSNPPERAEHGSSVRAGDTNVTPEKIKELLVGINKLGPKTVVITDATRGAYLLDAERLTKFMPPYPDEKAPVERTGAGDAFASTFVSALALGKTVAEALTWAPINSMSVVQKIGAQAGLLSRPELENHLSHAPADYQPKEI